MKMFLQIIDKVLYGNLMVAGATYAAEKTGVIDIKNSILNVSREDVLQTALLVSAVTGAIYGTYRVLKLAYDGILLLIKKFKSK